MILLNVNKRQHSGTQRVAHLLEPLGWAVQLKAAAGWGSQRNLWVWNGKQWPFLCLWMTTLKANQQEWQGKREPRSWAVCPPEGSIQERSPPNWAPSQPVWNPVTCLPISEWKRLSFRSRTVVFCLQCPCSPGLIVCWEKKQLNLPFSNGLFGSEELFKTREPYHINEGCCQD